MGTTCESSIGGPEVWCCGRRLADAGATGGCRGESVADPQARRDGFRLARVALGWFQVKRDPRRDLRGGPPMPGGTTADYTAVAVGSPVEGEPYWDAIGFRAVLWVPSGRTIAKTCVLVPAVSAVGACSRPLGESANWRGSGTGISGYATQILYSRFQTIKPPQPDSLCPRFGGGVSHPQGTESWEWKNRDQHGWEEKNYERRIETTKARPRNRVDHRGGRDVRRGSGD